MLKHLNIPSQTERQDEKKTLKNSEGLTEKNISFFVHNQAMVVQVKGLFQHFMEVKTIVDFVRVQESSFLVQDVSLKFRICIQVK